MNASSRLKLRVAVADARARTGLFCLVRFLELFGFAFEPLEMRPGWKGAGHGNLLSFALDARESSDEKRFRTDASKDSGGARPLAADSMRPDAHSPKDISRKPEMGTLRPPAR